MDQKDVDAANTRAAARLSGTPKAVAARYDQRLGCVLVELTSGLMVAFRPQDAEGLQHGTPQQLRRVTVSPSGLGLHWADLDADLYVPSLLQGLLGSRPWMAAQLGRKGGQARSAAKSRAARANGKRGGRPTKTSAAARHHDR